MAKKAELLEEAKKLNLEVTEKNTIAEIEAAIKGVKTTAETLDIAPEVVVEEVSADEVSDKPAAKAGKRSEKAQAESEAKLEKEARKEAGDTTPQSEDAEGNVKKGPAPKVRPLVERKGKKYQAAFAKIEKGKAYPLADALKLAVETTTTTFDSSVELHVALGVDPRQADQNIRTTVSLPHGTGKTVRVAAFVNDDDAAAATKAGADVAGETAVAKLLDKEQFDFDVLVATPQMMPKLGKYARQLGPRGLMPNPKSGTVSTNPAAAVKESKGGKVEYRVDKQAIIHVAVGKVSFGADKLQDNAKTFFDSLQSVKPTSLKGSYILSVNATTTMGPGIKIDQNTL